MMDNGLLKICPAEVPLDPVLTQQLPKAIGQIKKNVEWSLNKENMKLAEASEELHICLDRAKTSLSECLHRPEVLEPHLGEIIAPISSYLLNRMELCLSEHIHGTEADYKSAVMQHAKSLNILFKMIFSLMNLNGRERIISYFSFGYEVVEPVVMFAYHLPGESEYWEATYVCAAWLSKLCLIPTKIESVDNEVFDHKLFDRLLGIAKVYAFSRGQECVLGAALLAALISRRDVKKEKFDETISWIIDKARDKDASARDVFCSLQILNKIFTTSSKVRFSGRVMDFVSISDSIHKNVNSHYAPTRAKLSKFDALIIEIFVGSNSPAILDGAESYEQSQVAVVKRVMDNMFSLLEDRNQDVRCKTAKYAAYVACLIDPTVGEGMISFLMNAFDIDQSTVVDEDFGRIRNFQILSDKLWHGMCMYISEMIRASLVTDSALDKIVDIVQECIFFYYRSSDIEVGMQVREAACCVIWCIATTFSGDTLERVAKKVLGPLLSAAILDAEVTVRRASVTTLQELLKRIKPSEFSHELQKGVTHHSVASKVNSMGALAVNMSRYSDYSRDILKKILFHCLESKDRTVRISCSESLARITVEQNSWMLSILRRLNLMAKERSGYASHSAICTLYHIYNMLDRPSLSSDELYAATISVLMRHGNSEERNIKGRKKNIKLEILHSIAICKLIRSIYLNEHHLNFIVGRCEEENIRIHEVARNQLLLALESSDVGLQNEASLAIGALSMSSAAFCEIGVHENVINILENPADHKLNVLQRAVLCALSIVNIDSNIYEHEIDLLCHIASEAKIPGKQYTFCHSIRKSIIGGIGQFFSSLVLSSRPTTSLNSCLLKILKAAIDLLDDYTVSHEGDVGSQIREMTSDLLRTISPYIYSSETPVCRDPLVCVQPCIIRECVGKLLRLAVEKIGLVRESAGAALEVLIDNKYIEFEDKHILASIIGTAPIQWSDPKSAFLSTIELVKYKYWRQPIVVGLITSYGALSKSLSGPCTNAFKQLVCRLSATPNELSDYPYTTIEDLIDLVVNIMLENRHCNRIYYPALELLEFFACDGILGKHASTSNNRTIVDLIKKRLEVSSNVRELCSSIKLCVYMGLSLLTHRNCPKSPIFFEYLELATSGLSHRYPRVRDVTFENIYSHYTMLLCCTGIDEIPRAIFEEIDEAHPLVFTSISDEDAENVKTKLLDAMRPYSYFPTDEYTRQHVEKTLNAG